MKRTAAYFLAFLLLVHFSYSQEKRVKVTAQKANVYLEQSANSPIVETLLKDSVLVMQGYVATRGWFAVRISADAIKPAKAGYIQASLVEFTKDRTRNFREDSIEAAKVIDKKPEKKAETKNIETADAGKGLQKEKLIPEKPGATKPETQKPVTAKKEEPVAKEKTAPKAEAKTEKEVKVQETPPATVLPVTPPAKSTDEKPEKKVEDKKIVTADATKGLQKEKLIPEKPSAPKTETQKPITPKKEEPAAPTKTTREAEAKKPSEEELAAVTKAPQDIRLVPVESMPSRLRPFALGVSVGYAATSTFGSGLDLAGIANLSISRMIGIDARFRVYRGDVGGDASPLSQGRMTENSLQLGIKLRFLAEKTLSPYMVAGGAYFINSFALSKEIVDEWQSAGFSISESVHNTFGPFIGGGLNLQVTPAASVIFDARYCPASAKGTWEMVETATGVRTSVVFKGVRMNALVVGMGILIWF